MKCVFQERIAQYPATLDGKDQETAVAQTRITQCLRTPLVASPRFLPWDALLRCLDHPRAADELRY